MSMSYKEKIERVHREYEEFFGKNVELLKNRMPAMELASYLRCYDETKYGLGAFHDRTSYSRYVSPHHYRDEILDRFKSKFLYHFLPSMSMDGRFLIFVAQLDSDTDTHAGFAVSARDTTETELEDERGLDFAVHVDIYTRHAERFVSFLTDNRDLQEEVYDLKETPIGFGSEGIEENMGFGG